MKFSPRVLPVVLALLWPALPPARADAPARPDLAGTVPPNPLPAPSVTHHTVNLPGGPLRFKATAGAIRLGDAQSGAPIADIAFTAFEREGAGEPAERPLTVALNGGPGASSAWLDLGAVGPWRLPVRLDDISPGSPPRLVDNADTWLDFTDLLFIDPLGTGYSRTLGKGEEAKSFWSVEGDVSSLATVIRKWLLANDRLASPKFILGESYGGFRAPKLARRLEDSDGIGINGIAMLSPVLDFGWFHLGNNPLGYATHLPSLVAAARGLRGPNPRAQLAAVESYASGPYLVDLYRGRRDTAAVARVSAAVAELTGLDLRFVQRLGGRVDPSVLTREKNRDAGRVASSYDGTVTGYDPTPFAPASHGEDPILDGLKAPFATAAAEMTARRLNWPIQARYEILNGEVNRRWDWDGARRTAEVTGDLAALLSLDPHFRAVVMHGATDQVTPYFASKMLIDQIPAYGDASRLRLVVYGGGHMPYLDDEARAAMHEDGRRLVTGQAPEGQR